MATTAQQDKEEAPPMIVYGHDWCPHATWLRDTLQEHALPHEWRDVNRGDPAWREELLGLAGGNLSVPTIRFPDGTVWVEPHPDKVLKRFGQRPQGMLARIRGWFG